MGKKPYQNIDDKLNLFAFISTHIQLLLGLILWVQLFGEITDMAGVMKDSVQRLRLIEHPMAMLIGIGVITYGRISAKKITDATLKHKRVALTFLVGTVLIIMRIPAWG